MGVHGNLNFVNFIIQAILAFKIWQLFDLKPYLKKNLMVQLWAHLYLNGSKIGTKK